MNNSSPLVSVVMSVYNGEKYLRDAIDSILNQTYENFEFIIINDGSTDATSKILSEYRQKDNRVIVHAQENMGLTKSLNKGCNFAKGEFIARMDADDISLPTRIEKQVQYLFGHPEIGLIGTYVENLGQPERKLKKPAIPDDDRFLRNYLTTKNSVFTHGSVMFRKSIFDKAGGYRFPFSEDHELWLRMLQYCRLGIVQEILYRFRPVEGSFSYRHHPFQMKFGKLARQCHLLRERGQDDTYFFRQQSNKILKKTVPWTKKKTQSFFYLTKGKIHLNLNISQDARKLFLNSIYENPFWIQTYLCFLLTFLPHSWFRWLKKLLRRYYNFFQEDHHGKTIKIPS